MLNGISPFGYGLRFLGIGKDPLQMTAEERALNSYYDRVSVFQVEKSRVIAIEFISSDPELAAKAANTIAEDYLALHRATKQQDTRAAGLWLAGEIEKLRGKVAEAEARVEEFRAKSNLLIGANNTTLSNQQLAEVNSQLSAARSRKAESEAKAQFIRDLLRTGKSLESADIVNSELIRRLAEQRVTLRAQLAEQSSTLLEGHPRIKELKAQIADLDGATRAEAERLARSLENDARIAGARLDGLSSNLDQLKRQAASTNGQDVQLRALEREAKSQRDLLESYLAKYRETAARDNLNAIPADARIISRATVSNTPFFPKKLPIVLIASLATLFVAAGMITTRELLLIQPDRSVARLAAVPTAAATAAAPTAPLVPEPPAVSMPPQSVPEPDPAPVPPGGSADRSIAAIAGELRDAGRKRLLVVGADRDAGAAIVATALARLIGHDARVVLVDLSFAAPKLAAIAVDPSGPGIVELVRGAASFGQVITRDRSSRVHVVPTGRVTGESKDILASERLRMGIDALAQAYDHVVINAGAVPDMDIERVAELAPNAVLVATGSTAEVAAARERLAAGGVTEITVLAETDARPAAA